MGFLSQVINGIIVACGAFTFFFLVASVLSLLEKLQNRLSRFEWIASITFLVVGIPGLYILDSPGLGSEPVLTRVSAYITFVPVALLLLIIFLRLSNR